MRHKTALASQAVFLCVLLAAGCQNKGGGDTVRIGVITSLTGSLAAFGEAHKNGYAIARDEINAKGGLLGKKVELDIYDDQSKPDQAVQGVSKLVDQGLIVNGGQIAAHAFTQVTFWRLSGTNMYRVRPLLLTSTTPSLGSFLVEITTFDTEAVAFASRVADAPVAGPSTMTAAAKQAGIDLVAVESYEAKSPDYKAVLQRVKKANPEVIYFCSYLLDATTLMRQAREMDLNPKYYTSAGTGFAAAEFPTPKGAGKNAEYTFSVSQWLPEAKWAGSKEFDAEYFKRFNSHPAYHAMQAYSALRVAAQAISDAKSAESGKIRDAIKNLNMDMTPFGPIRFDAIGQNQHPVLITQVQGGKYRVVYPAEAADSKAIIPAPRWSQR